jgi:hypothetical protein
MDISKAASGAALPSPSETSKAGPGGAGGSDRRFADVLGQGGQPGAPGGAQQAGAPFRAPILDPDMGLAKAGGPTKLRAQKLEQVDRRPSVEMTGERAGTRPGGSPPIDPSQVASGASWQRLATDTMKAENKMDAMIAAARNGKAFSASELLAIQVEVFRYSQTVEVISRSTDKLVGAVKQTLGTQV